MKYARAIAPIASVAFLALIAALPWGLPANDRFALPLLPVVAIHYWTLRHDAWLPEWVVFLAGLALDVLTQGPLGYWALMYLAAHLVATLSTRLDVRGSTIRFGLLAAAIAVVTLLAWTVASVYFLEIADPRPYIVGAAITIVASLVLLPVLRLLDDRHVARSNFRLTRGV